MPPDMPPVCSLHPPSHTMQMFVCMPLHKMQARACAHAHTHMGTYTHVSAIFLQENASMHGLPDQRFLTKGLVDMFRVCGVCVCARVCVYLKGEGIGQLWLPACMWPWISMSSTAHLTTGVLPPPQHQHMPS